VPVPFKRAEPISLKLYARKRDGQDEKKDFLFLVILLQYFLKAGMIK
jgi:hypothetical protein